jgi:hypothetical protein
MKTKNLMIGLVAAAALAQVGIGAANAAVSFSYYTTGGTVLGSGSSSLTVNGIGSPGAPVSETTPPATNLTLFTITPTVVGTGSTTFGTPTSEFMPSVTIIYNGMTDTLDNFSQTVNFSGVLSNKKDTVKVDLQKPSYETLDIDGEDFTVTLTGKGNPGASGSSGYIDGKITANASPAPEPSEVGTLVLCTFGLLGLMVRARKARAVGSTIL